MFEKEILVPAGTWRAAALLHELQELSGDAVAAAHATGAELKPLGLMWVVVRYDLSLTRPLRPGEALHCVTWANPFRHRMSQRNYVILDAAGDTVLRGAGIWAVADRESRTMIDPAERGVRFETELNGRESPRPGTPEKFPLTDECRYRVSDADLDMNGHMNNTRYFALAESCIGEAAARAALRRTRVVFLNEAVPDEELTVRWGADPEGEGSCWYVTGTGRGRDCFQMGLEYFA